MKSHLENLFLVLAVGALLFAAIRGIAGNPTHQSINTPQFREEGPLELSPERGRFALIFSLVEDGSAQFSLPVAKFVTPDLAYKDGEYVSLFAPGVSYLATPGYLVGRMFNAAQVGAFAVIGIFALLNVLLIRAIAKKLGAGEVASILASLVFLFATPAFAYATTLYQHHITVFLLLASIYALLKWKGIWPLFLVWIFVVGSVSIDYPNFFMFFPIGVYALGRVVKKKYASGELQVNLKLAGLLSFISVLIPVTFFLWTNSQAYGNPIQLAGTLQTVKDFDESGSPVFSLEDDENTAEEPEPLTTPSSEKEKTAVSFFRTRNLINGLYIHLFSVDRGVLWYAPIMLLAIFGVPYALKKESTLTSFLVAVVGVNIFLYSMWSDPWGGWAFGSRYLIPTYAIMSVFLALALTKMRSKAYFFVFLLLLIYSVSVNSLGALTSNRVPPKIEAVALESTSNKRERYTYFRNWEYLTTDGSKSFVYREFAKNLLTPREYYFLFTATLIFLMGGQLSYLYIRSREKNIKNV